MPNRVISKVKMTGITNLPIFTTVTDESTKESRTFFDFNKIIPMPESLSIDTGSIEEVAIESVLRKLENRLFDLKWPNYRTMSDEEYEERKHGKTDEEMEKLGLQYISNKVLYGHTTWYDWRCANWGTKCNSYDNKQVDDDTIEFSTAWSSPEPIMLKLSKMFPDIQIKHWWADEDIGCNTGYREYLNGSVTYDCCNDNYSDNAYETYVECWGETDRLYRDEDGNWKVCENYY